MSADTSDPALAKAVQAVHDDNDPTKWLVAAYASSSSSVIVLLDSGPDPALPALRARVDAPAKENGASFAYASVAGQGLVVLRIGDGVAGVRRAKAVLHSRAFATLFPDYLALATVSKPGELTDAFVAERLGLSESAIAASSATGATEDAVQGVGEAKQQAPAPAPMQAPAPVQAPAPAQAPVSAPTPLPTPPAALVEKPVTPQPNGTASLLPSTSTSVAATPSPPPKPETRAQTQVSPPAQMPVSPPAPTPSGKRPPRPLPSTSLLTPIRPDIDSPPLRPLPDIPSPSSAVSISPAMASTPDSTMLMPAERPRKPEPESDRMELVHSPVSLSPQGGPEAEPFSLSEPSAFTQPRAAPAVPGHSRRGSASSSNYAPSMQRYPSHEGSSNMAPALQRYPSREAGPSNAVASSAMQRYPSRDGGPISATPSSSSMRRLPSIEAGPNNPAISSSLQRYPSREAGPSNVPVSSSMQRYPSRDAGPSNAVASSSMQRLPSRDGGPISATPSSSSMQRLPSREAGPSNPVISSNLQRYPSREAGPSNAAVSNLQRYSSRDSGPSEAMVSPSVQRHASWEAGPSNAAVSSSLQRFSSRDSGPSEAMVSPSVPRHASWDAGPSSAAVESLQRYPSREAGPSSGAVSSSMQRYPSTGSGPSSAMLSPMQRYPSREAGPSNAAISHRHTASEAGPSSSAMSSFMQRRPSWEAGPSTPHVSHRHTASEAGPSSAAMTSSMQRVPSREAAPRPAAIHPSMHRDTASEAGPSTALPLPPLQRQTSWEAGPSNAAVSSLQRYPSREAGPSNPSVSLSMQRYPSRDAGPSNASVQPGSSGNAGPSQAGPSNAGPSHAGPSTAGPSYAGPSQAGPSQAGPSNAGPSYAGSSHAGPSHAGPSQAGPSYAEQPSQAGPSQAGPSQAGPSQAGPSRAGPSRAGPSHAGPSHAGPSTAGPSYAGPSQAGPSRAGPSTVMSNNAGPSQAGRSHAGPSNTAQSYAGPSNMSQAGPSRGGPSHAGPSQAGPSHAGASQVGPSNATQSYAAPSQSGSSRAGPSDASQSYAGSSNAGPSNSGPSDFAPTAASSKYPTFGPSYGRTVDTYGRPLTERELPDLPTPEVSDAESDGLAPVVARVFQRPTPSPKPGDKTSMTNSSSSKTLLARSPVPGPPTPPSVTGASSVGSPRGSIGSASDTPRIVASATETPRAGSMGHPAPPHPVPPMAMKLPPAPSPVVTSPRTPTGDAPPIPKRSASRMSATPPTNTNATLPTPLPVPSPQANRTVRPGSTDSGPSFPQKDRARAGTPQGSENRSIQGPSRPSPSRSARSQSTEPVLAPLVKAGKKLAGPRPLNSATERSPHEQSHASHISHASFASFASQTSHNSHTSRGSNNSGETVFRSKSREHARQLAAAAAAAASETTDRQRRSRSRSDASSRSRGSARSRTNSAKSGQQSNTMIHDPMPNVRLVAATPAPLAQEKPKPSPVHIPGSRPREPPHGHVRGPRRQGSGASMVGLGLGHIGPTHRDSSASTASRESLTVPASPLQNLPPRSSSREALPLRNGSMESLHRPLVSRQNNDSRSNLSIAGTESMVDEETIDPHAGGVSPTSGASTPTGNGHARQLSSDMGHSRRPSRTELPPPTASSNAQQRTSPEQQITARPANVPPVVTAEVQAQQPQLERRFSGPESPFPPVPARSQNRLSQSIAAATRTPPPPSPAPDVPLPPLPPPEPERSNSYRGREHHIVSPGHGRGHNREPTEYDIDKILADVQDPASVPSVPIVRDTTALSATPALEPLPPLPEAAMPVQVQGQSPVIAQTATMGSPPPRRPPPSSLSIPENATRALHGAIANFVSPITPVTPVDNKPKRSSSSRKPVPPIEPQLSTQPARQSSVRSNSTFDSTSSSSAEVTPSLGSVQETKSDLAVQPATPVSESAEKTVVVDEDRDIPLSPITSDSGSVTLEYRPRSTSTLSVSSTPSTPPLETYHSPMIASPLSPDVMDLNELMGAVTGAISMSVGRPAAARVVNLSSLSINNSANGHVSVPRSGSISTASQAPTPASESVSDGGVEALTERSDRSNGQGPVPESSTEQGLVGQRQGSVSEVGDSQPLSQVTSATGSDKSNVVTPKTSTASKETSPVSMSTDSQTTQDITTPTSTPSLGTERRLLSGRDSPATVRPSTLVDINEDEPLRPRTTRISIGSRPGSRYDSESGSPISAVASKAKMRLFRTSPRIITNGDSNGPDSPLSPSSPGGFAGSPRTRTASLTRAFRLRKGSAGSTGSPPVRNPSLRSDNGDSDGQKELTGLGIFGAGGSGYRTNTGGIGFTPSKGRSRTNSKSSSPTDTPSRISVEAVLHSARQKELVDHNEALERWRRAEEERAKQRAADASPISPIAAQPIAPPAHKLPASLIGMDPSEAKFVKGVELDENSVVAIDKTPKVEQAASMPAPDPMPDLADMNGTHNESSTAPSLDESQTPKVPNDVSSMAPQESTASSPTVGPNDDREISSSDAYERPTLMDRMNSEDRATLATRRNQLIPRPESRVISTASSWLGSEETGMYDSTSEEPHLLSIAMVKPPGSPVVMSPVEQLTSAATAARAHRRNRSASIQENADGRVELTQVDEAKTPHGVDVERVERVERVEVLERVSRSSGTPGPSIPSSAASTHPTPMSAALDAFSPIDPHQQTISMSALADQAAEKEAAEKEERELHAKREAEREQAELEENQRLEEERRVAQERELERKQAERERIKAAAAAELARHEEKQRLEKERLEQERIETEARLQGIREQLRTGKADGSIMLRGWVTVQTETTLTWRRRYFHLMGTEMQLFKNDNDKEPLATAPLAGAKFSEEYEDSQVRGSWELKSGSGETYLMFADTSEDKDVILEGLAIAIG